MGLSISNILFKRCYWSNACFCISFAIWFSMMAVYIIGIDGQDNHCYMKINREWLLSYFYIGSFYINYLLYVTALISGVAFFTISVEQKNYNHAYIFQNVIIVICIVSFLVDTVFILMMTQNLLTNNNETRKCPYPVFLSQLGILVAMVFKVFSAINFIVEFKIYYTKIITRNKKMDLI